MDKAQARRQIELFASMNDDFRQLAKITYKHPSPKQLERFGQVCENLADISDPLVEAMFYKDTSPALVKPALKTVVNEINSNYVLLAALEDEMMPKAWLANEFRDYAVERVINEDPEPAAIDGSVRVLVTSDPDCMSVDILAAYIGAMHSLSVDEIYNGLINSDRVSLAIERHIKRRERLNLALVGAVAFTSSIGGHFVYDRLKSKQ
jgi:hypothetical protein